MIVDRALLFSSSAPSASFFSAWSFTASSLIVWPPPVASQNLPRYSTPRAKQKAMPDESPWPPFDVPSVRIGGHEMVRAKNTAVRTQAMGAGAESPVVAVFVGTRAYRRRG